MTNKDTLIANFLNREREVNRLMRRLARVDSWANATVSLASRIASSTSREDGLQILTDMLVNDLEFDTAAAVWDSTQKSFPHPANGECELCAAVYSGEVIDQLGVVEMLEPSGPWGQVFRCSVNTESALMFAVGYRKETFEFLEHDDTHERLDKIAEILVHPFEALKLRLDLTRERDSLQERVQEATTDLRSALETADEARRAAERSARVRSQFLAHMSHEIRTPMTAILGYAELLSDPKTRPSQHNNYISIINGSSKHLLQLLDDILDLARIESGQFKLENQEGSIRQVLQDVASLMRVKAVEDGLELSLQLQGDFPTVARFDLPRFRQVVLNIVSNAIKFTSSGGVEIRARVNRRLSQLIVEIEDTGTGIAPEKMESIFEEFSTSDAEGTGAGLGLAISKRLARSMGGDITVMSEVGKGSCFVVRIRFETTHHATWSAGFHTPSETIPETMELTHNFVGRVLIAEDTPVIREVAVKWLENLGFEVVAVENGKEAFDTALSSAEPFDVIFMDMQMPVLDGYRSTGKLRERGVDVPVIALTAHAMAGEREKCIEAGCTDYLSKPFSQRQLAGAIAKYVPPVDLSSPPTSTVEEDQVLKELHGEFLDDLAKMRAELTAARHAADRGLCRKIAHKIAGSASTFGYNELANLSKSISSAAKSDILDLFTVCDELAFQITKIVK